MKVQYFFCNQTPAHLAIVEYANGTSEVRCYGFEFDLGFAQSQDVSYEVEYYEVSFALLASFIYEHDRGAFDCMRAELEDQKFDLELNMKSVANRKAYNEALNSVKERVGHANAKLSLMRYTLERAHPRNNIVEFTR